MMNVWFAMLFSLVFFGIALAVLIQIIPEKIGKLSKVKVILFSIILYLLILGGFYLVEFLVRPLTS